MVPPSGPLEDARVASQGAQQARVRIRVGSNTTIVGVDRTATIRGAWFDLRGTSAVPRTNIIIRNLRFEDTYDCFPAWDPTDGATGNWNALYDSISLRETDHVWIDHNEFADVTTADETLPIYFGRLFQVHDGLLDITNASRLRHRLVERVPRSRQGDAHRLVRRRHCRSRPLEGHAAPQHLRQRGPADAARAVWPGARLQQLLPAKKASAYRYSWGVGRESAIYAEGNVFHTDAAITPEDFISVFTGTAIVTLTRLSTRRRPTISSTCGRPTTTRTTRTSPTRSGGRRPSSAGR